MSLSKRCSRSLPVVLCAIVLATAFSADLKKCPKIYDGTSKQEITDVSKISTGTKSCTGCTASGYPSCEFRCAKCDDTNSDGYYTGSPSLAAKTSLLDLNECAWKGVKSPFVGTTSADPIAYVNVGDATNAAGKVVEEPVCVTTFEGFQYDNDVYHSTYGITVSSQPNLFLEQVRVKGPTFGARNTNYQITYAAAETICKSRQGRSVCTLAELGEAVKIGAKLCTCSWASNNRAYMLAPDACPEDTRTGVVSCSTISTNGRAYDLYCCGSAGRTAAPTAAPTTKQAQLPDPTPAPYSPVPLPTPKPTDAGHPIEKSIAANSKVLSKKDTWGFKDEDENGDPTGAAGSPSTKMGANTVYGRIYNPNYDGDLYFEQIAKARLTSGPLETFSFAEAQSACGRRSRRLCEESELTTASEDGISTCSCGWTADGFARFPMATATAGCGDRKGVVFCGKVSKYGYDQMEHAYCCGQKLRSCKLSDETVKESGWSGSGVGTDNWCNSCTCDDGTLTCTKRICSDEPNSYTFGTPVDVAGKFSISHVSYGEVYNIDSNHAQNACQSVGMDVCTLDQLTEAQGAGFGVCSCGWTQNAAGDTHDKYSMFYPMTTKVQGCGSVGINPCARATYKGKGVGNVHCCGSFDSQKVCKSCRCAGEDEAKKSRTCVAQTQGTACTNWGLVPINRLGVLACAKLPGSDDAMRIYVYDVATQRTITLDVTAGSSVGQVRKSLKETAFVEYNQDFSDVDKDKELTGTDADANSLSGVTSRGEFLLTFGGNKMEDENTLLDYKVTPDSTVYFIRTTKDSTPRVSQSCPKGWKGPTDGTICIIEADTGAKPMSQAIDSCAANGARVCTAQDMQDLCAQGIVPFHQSTGWLGNLGKSRADSSASLMTWTTDGYPLAKGCEGNFNFVSGPVNSGHPGLPYRCCKGGVVSAQYTAQTGFIKAMTVQPVCSGKAYLGNGDVCMSDVAGAQTMLGAEKTCTAMNMHVCSHNEMKAMCSLTNPYDFGGDFTEKRCQTIRLTTDSSSCSQPTDKSFFVRGQCYYTESDGTKKKCDLMNDAQDKSLKGFSKLPSSCTTSASGCELELCDVGLLTTRDFTVQSKAELKSLVEITDTNTNDLAHDYFGIGASAYGSAVNTPTGFTCNEHKTLCYRRMPTKANAMVALETCRDLGARMCTYQDMQELCAAGLTPYKGANEGWYGDHGVSNNWDDEYGTWNGNSCTEDNDGTVTEMTAATLDYACCKAGEKKAGSTVTCPSGLTSGTTSNGEICSSAVRPAATMHTAINDCSKRKARVCTHADMFQLCGSGLNPYADKNPGWYGDHGTVSNWDNEYGSWNGNKCAANNDGAVFDLDTRMVYRCCGHSTGLDGASVWWANKNKVCPDGFTRAGGMCWNKPTAKLSYYEAMKQCKLKKSHMCTHNDMQEICGSGQNPYAEQNSGWYGDHATLFVNNEKRWDNHYGTWNRGSCTSDNDGLAQASTNPENYRCCTAAYIKENPLPDISKGSKILGVRPVDQFKRFTDKPVEQFAPGASLDDFWTKYVSNSGTVKLSVDFRVRTRGNLEIIAEPLYYNAQLSQNEWTTLLKAFNTENVTIIANQPQTKTVADNIVDTAVSYGSGNTISVGERLVSATVGTEVTKFTSLAEINNMQYDSTMTVQVRRSEQPKPWTFKTEALAHIGTWLLMKPTNTDVSTGASFDKVCGTPNYYAAGHAIPATGPTTFDEACCKSDQAAGLTTLAATATTYLFYPDESQTTCGKDADCDSLNNPDLVCDTPDLSKITIVGLDTSLFTNEKDKTIPLELNTPSHFKDGTPNPKAQGFGYALTKIGGQSRVTKTVSVANTVLTSCQSSVTVANEVYDIQLTGNQITIIYPSVTGNQITQNVLAKLDIKCKENKARFCGVKRAVYDDTQMGRASFPFPAAASVVPQRPSKSWYSDHVGGSNAWDNTFGSWGSLTTCKTADAPLFSATSSGVLPFKCCSKASQFTLCDEHHPDLKEKGKMCFEPSDSAASKGVKGCPKSVGTAGKTFWTLAGSLCISEQQKDTGNGPTCKREGGHICTYTEIQQACSELTSSFTSATSTGYLGDVSVGVSDGKSFIGTWKISGSDLCAAAAESGFDGPATKWESAANSAQSHFCCRSAGFF